MQRVIPQGSYERKGSCQPVRSRLVNVAFTILRESCACRGSGEESVTNSPGRLSGRHECHPEQAVFTSSRRAADKVPAILVVLNAHGGKDFQRAASMTIRRSHHEPLTAHNQRPFTSETDSTASPASMQDLERTLQSLESRLGQPAPILQARQRAEKRSRQLRDPDYSRAPDRERGSTSVSVLAAQLKALRDDMEQQMTAPVTQEFETLRAEIRKLAKDAQRGAPNKALLNEIERLSAAVADLSKRGDDRTIGLLRLELEQLKKSVSTLAREDTLRAVGDRWDAFDSRMKRFEDEVRNKPAPVQDTKALDGLTQRLEKIAAAVDILPDSLSMRALEDKVHVLAGALDQLARKQDAQSDQTFSMIAERLDEITQAMASNALHAPMTGPDPSALQRVENRLSSLANQIEELLDERPSQAMAHQLANLTARVDDLSTQAAMPQAMVDRLGRQIGAIVERLDHQPPYPDFGPVLDGLEQRFQLLADALDRRQEDVIDQSSHLLRDIESRLDGLVDRLDDKSRSDQTHLETMMDARFNDLAARLDDRLTYGPEAAGIRELDLRLSDMSDRFDAVAGGGLRGDDEMMARLQVQLAELSTRLSAPSRNLETQDFSARFDELQRSLSDQQDALIETARATAAEAVREWTQQRGDRPGDAGLSAELRALEELTRDSDARNTRTFDAIHQTLTKIVDRLNRMETRPDQEPASKTRLADTPPIFAEPMPHFAQSDAWNEARSQSSADRSVLSSSQQSWMFQPVAPSHLDARSREDDFAPTEPNGLDAAFPSLDQPLHQPLSARIPQEPGKPTRATPDLTAILKRVRDQRAGSVDRDFDADGDQDGLSEGTERRIGHILRFRRNTMLMATVAMIVGLGGFQLTRTYLQNQSPVTVEENLVAATSPVPQSEDVKEQSEPVALAGSTQKPVTQTPSQPTQPQSTQLERQDAQAAQAFTPPSPLATGSITRDDPQVAALPRVEDAASQQAISALEPTELTPEAPQTAALQTNVGNLGLSAGPSFASAARMQAQNPLQAPESLPEAVGPKALRDAAQNGDAKAMFEIGNRFAEGHDGQPDMDMAARWYRLSADQGFAPAQYRIGNLYEKGMGVERNLDEARRFYELGASQGNASAMHNLAVLHAMGAVGKTDNTAAVRWFTEAAERGVTDSQFNLGIMAAKGAGMKRDFEASYKWFDLVARTGDKDAASKRDEIAASLSPEALARARANAVLWRAKAEDPRTNSVEIPAEWRDASDVADGVDMKQAITNIQRILNKNGFDAGQPDGLIGGKTKAAIIAFQSANGLTADGEVNEPLVRALLKRK